MCRHIDLCPETPPCDECQAELDEYNAEQNRLSEILARDPWLDASCREATEEEWWIFIGASACCA